MSNFVLHAVVSMYSSGTRCVTCHDVSFTLRCLTLSCLCLLVAVACRPNAEVPAGWDDLSSVKSDAQFDASPYDVDESIVFAKLTNNDELLAVVGGEQWRALRVEQGELTDAGLRHLDRFPELAEIVLRNSPITDVGVSEIAKLSSLRVVNLPHAEITDKGVRELAELPNLELLRLGSSKITDRSLEILRESHSLRFLHLIDVPISDDGLQALHGWQQLESLYLDGAEVTGRGVSQLLMTCPDLHLHLDQQHHDLDLRKGHE